MVYGFVVKKSKGTYDVFDTEQRAIVFRVNSEQFELGQWDLKLETQPETTQVSTSKSVDEEGRETTTLWVCTMVLKPDMSDFDVSVQEKHAGAVWAPLIGWISDPQEICKDQLVNEQIPVKMKYQNHSLPYFEVFEMVPTAQRHLQNEVEKEWRDECNRIRTEGPFFGRPISSLWNVYGYRKSLQTGLMIGEAKHGGYGQLAANDMYVPMSGIIRAVHDNNPERLAAAKIGKWFEVTQYSRRRANKRIPVDDPYPTAIINGAIEVSITFRFEPGLFEPIANEHIADWSERSRGIYNSIVIKNDHLNLISVPRPAAVFIIQQVEKRFGKVDEYEVEAGIRLKRGYQYSYIENETNPIFEVRKIRKIGQIDRGDGGRRESWNFSALLATVMKPDLEGFHDLIKRKYQDQVWSPSVGWLSDPEKVFESQELHTPRATVLREETSSHTYYTVSKFLKIDPNLPKMIDPKAVNVEWKPAKEDLKVEEILRKFRSEELFLELHQKHGLLSSGKVLRGVCIKNTNTPFYFFSPALGLILLDEHERERRNIPLPARAFWYFVEVTDCRNGGHPSFESYRAINGKMTSGFPTVFLHNETLKMKVFIEMDEMFHEKGLAYCEHINLVQIDQKDVQKIWKALEKRYGSREKASKEVREDRLKVCVTVKLREDFVRAFEQHCYAPMFKAVEFLEDLEHIGSGKTVPLKEKSTR
ncbi:unnamed protein product [Caenorhabditis sp. 36 PRJEB53466]|nr:unnamed protein product [Caenorhabditis sp. 36 PRJEB53466]